MCKYEQLVQYAGTIGLTVIEKDFKSNAKGLCKGKKIGIRKNMSDTEKACVLAEEIGHYYTTVGNILDQTNTNHRKQELIARKWAVNKMLDITDLFHAAAAGCDTFFEIAEYLGVTEEFLTEALAFFKRKYGYSFTYENKTIIFCDHGFCIK